MIGKQVINNAQELLIPFVLKTSRIKTFKICRDVNNLCVHMCFRKIKLCIHNWKLGARSRDENQTPWEQDYHLIENEGLFDEYLEMGESKSPVHFFSNPFTRPVQCIIIIVF